MKKLLVPRRFSAQKYISFLNVFRIDLLFLIFLKWFGAVCISNNCWRFLGGLRALIFILSIFSLLYNYLQQHLIYIKRYFEGHLIFYILLLDIIIMIMKKYIKRLKITLMEISKMKNSTLLKKKQKKNFFFWKFFHTRIR